MSLGEVFALGGGSLVILLSIVQISPIKWNPWSAIARAIGRAINGEVLDKLSAVEKKVKALEDKQGEEAAKTARTRILRFADEIYLHQKHSKEHFDTVLADITDYDGYCASHKDFRNEMTVMAARWIKETYHQCLVDGTFLTGGKKHENQ